MDTQQAELIADVCDEAADIIGANGWLQGEPWPGSLHYRPGMPVCEMGALAVALGDRCWRRLPGDVIREADPRGTLATVAGAVEHHLGFPLTIWNDAPGRTEGEVVELLRGTAKKLREPSGR